MTDAERKQVVEDWNRTAIDFGAFHCLHRYFERWADMSPDRIAVAAGASSLSYRCLDSRTEGIAQRLRSLGMGPDAVAGLFAERSAEMVMGMLGILKAGAAYLPIDPSLPPARIQFMIEDAGATVVVNQEHLKKTMPATAARTVTLSREGLPDSISPDPAIYAASDAGPDNLAYVIYTSGSTGKPKGIGVTHRSIRNHMLWLVQDCPITEDDRVLQKTAFGFDASIWEFFAPLMTGAQLVMASPDGHQDARYLTKLMAEQSTTVVQFVPSMLRIVLGESGFARCRSLKAVYCGGEALTTEIKTKFAASSAATLRNLYGPTEATIDATSWECERSAELENVPIGRPIPNTQAHILDRRFEPVPIGLTGELYLGGQCLARGYIRQPAMTAAAFLPNPFGSEAGGRLYQTGDLARSLSDGNIQYLGRIGQQVKIRGFRVETGEIEAALAKHPDLREVAVVACERKQGEFALAAYLVPATDRPLDASGLRQFLKRDLPDYMLPAVLIPLKELPRTPNGKIDRRALPAPSWERDLSLPFDAPETPTQRAVAETLASLLGIDRVDISDNFFEIGAHSLVAAQMAARLYEFFRVELTIRTILEHPTVAELANYIDQNSRVEEATIGFSAVEPIPRARRTPAGPGTKLLPFSYAQQRLWLIEQINPGNHYYNIPAMVRISGELNIEALTQSVNHIVARHEALRTAFPSLSAQPAQAIRESVRIEIPAIDLSEFSESLKDREALKLAADEASRGFDLARAPLFRFKVITLSHTRSVLVMVMHHIISDGWSLGILVHELDALYESNIRGTPPNLPRLSVQYGDYSVWQREHLQGERLDKELRYWRLELKGAPAETDLPCDRIRPAKLSHQGATVTLVLDVGLSGELSRLAKSRNATQFMVLLTAFYVLLTKYTSQHDIVIGTPVANRDHTEIEPLIGFFVNTLPIRIKAVQRDSFAVVLERVKRTTLAAYSHQAAPFDKILEHVSPSRGMSAHPLFQVLFALQTAPAPSPRLSGLEAEVDYVDSGTAKFDLSLLMSAAEDRLEAVFEYSTDLFDRSTILRFSGHFERLLTEITHDDARPISDLQILTREELAVAQKSEDTPPVGEFVHHRFEAHAEESPARIALQYDDEHLSYGELNRRANVLAGKLQNTGVGPESAVAGLLDRPADRIVAAIGVMKAGGAYLDLGTGPGPDNPTSILAAFAVELLVTDAAAASPSHGYLTPVLGMDAEIDHLRGAAGNPSVPLCGENLAFLALAGGLDGKARVVGVSHQAIACLMDSEIERDQPRTGADQAIRPASFNPSLHECLLSLCRRGAVTDYPPFADNTVGIFGPLRIHHAGTAAGTAAQASHPIAGSQLHVLDFNVKPVPVGVVGNLYISGISIERAGVTRPGETADFLIPDSITNKPGARLYRTGDYGRRLADGGIQVFGPTDAGARVRETIKRHPSMVETELALSKKQAGVIETELRSIWSRVLGVDSLGLHDNFFELGGHSLKATQLVSEIRDAMNVDVPLGIMFEATTIAALARYIKERYNDD
ncbi:MAG TPA: amino acid adenylation domain-containing protein, partial [Blastocatellia bacterium]|nr:amino acid adenylation domain-containing protein [Blastocatellia bacterium]